MSETTIKEQEAPALLPCPFCGGQAYMTDHRASVYRFVHCQDCMVENGGRTEAEAIAAWNRRADPWIPVEERLPPISKRVIVFDMVAQEGWYNPDRGGWMAKGGYRLYNVTHWMDLPAEPSSFNSPEPEV